MVAGVEKSRRRVARGADWHLARRPRPSLSSYSSLVQKAVDFFVPLCCRGGHRFIVDRCSLANERRADDQGNPDNNLTSLEIGTGLLEVTTVTGTNSPVTTYYLVDGNNPTGYAQVIEQGPTPGTPTISYVWGMNLMEQVNAAGTANAGTYYFVVDGHGGTVALINASGNVVQTFHYDGFGNALGFTTATALTTYLYDTMSFDPASNNYYDDARFYNTGTGEFTQADYGYTGSLGLVWNSPASGDYAGPFVTLSLPYQNVPRNPKAKIGSWLSDELTSFTPTPAVLGTLALGAPEGEFGLADAIALQFHDMQRATASASRILNSFSVNLSASPVGTHAFGFSIGLGAGSGAGSGFAIDVTNYWQLLPSGTSVNFQ